ncbi:hypothetical protein J3F84DRAFT_156696 [Trichoderma pleuroticola]
MEQDGLPQRAHFAEIDWNSGGTAGPPGPPGDHFSPCSSRHLGSRLGVTWAVRERESMAEQQLLRPLHAVWVRAHAATQNKTRRHSTAGWWRLASQWSSAADGAAARDLQGSKDVTSCAQCSPYYLCLAHAAEREKPGRCSMAVCGLGSFLTCGFSQGPDTHTHTHTPNQLKRRRGKEKRAK